MRFCRSGWRPALVSLLVWVGAARADSPWLYGIHWYATDGDVEAMTGNKGVWIVENVNTWESPSASGQKSKFQTAVGRGHGIIVRLQPRWGWCVPRESEMTSYLSAVTSVANTLRDQVHIWQIGNEMDNWQVEYGDGYLAPADYVSRFKRIRAAIRSVQSSLGPQIVLLGPPTAFSPYLGGMLPYLDVGDVDGFAIHAYGVTSPAIVANSVLNFQAAVTEQIGTIDSYGGGLFQFKPVFITEFDRCSDPESTEWVSAQFLHLSFDWLNGWNSNSANHPVTGAAWFIYPDSGWGCFSLRNLKGGTRGQDNDVWDAFQYAASQNYAAGAMRQGIVTTAAASYSHVRYDLASPPAETFQVAAGGVGAMSYSFSADQPWLVVPAAGSSSGEWDDISIGYNLAGYGYGTHSGTVTMTAADAANSPIMIAFSVTFKAYGDFDGDGDADQEDFGEFQRCYTGEGIAQPLTQCAPARLEGGDNDVDLLDFAVFEACLSGANVPVDPACAANAS